VRHMARGIPQKSARELRREEPIPRDIALAVETAEPVEPIESHPNNRPLTKKSKPKLIKKTTTKRSRASRQKAVDFAEKMEAKVNKTLGRQAKRQKAKVLWD